MDIFLLYLWTRLDSIDSVISILFFVGLISTAICAIALGIAANTDGLDDPLTEVWKSNGLRLAKYTLAIMLIGVIIPSQKDAAIIAGGWAVKQVATSEGAQQLSSKTFALINGKLDEELSKLKKEP